MNRVVNILVVDDRIEGVMAVRAVLDAPEYNIVTASSGTEALKHLLHHDFAVIILDVQMPIMNGFETAEVIKTREKSKDIPIIFMSAINQDEQYVYQGYKVGAVDYLLKPFDPYILRSKVAIFVDIYLKNILIKEQAQRIYDSEIRSHAASISQLEIESLKRYQYLADFIPQIVFRVGSDGQKEYFNRVWYEYTGLLPEQSIGLNWKDVVHPFDLDELMKKIGSNKSGALIEVECRILNKHGQLRWHLVRVQPDLNSGRSWLGTATDIEDRKKHEVTQTFLSSAGETLVSSLDSNFIFESISKLSIPYFADWCSFDVLNGGQLIDNLASFHKDSKSNERVKNMQQLYWGHLIGIEDFNKCLLNDRPMIIKGSFKKDISPLNLSKVELDYVKELEHTSMMVIPLMARGNKLGVLTFGLDSGTRFYEEEDLATALELGRRIALALDNSKLYYFSQKAIEVRNDFLSIASHELNTPITSVKLHMQMIERYLFNKKNDQLDLPRLKKSIDSSIRQVDRLIHLIQVLLDVSRIQSGQLTFAFEELNVDEIVNDVIERHRELLKTYNSNLSLKSGGHLVANWDKIRIEQVMTNLINNAIKYAPGEIVITINDKGKDVEILIKDFGEGISKDKVPLIFDRFERGNFSNGISGLGLGLYIVKQIVEGHNGKIEVETEAHKGTCFSITLPKVVNESIQANYYQ